MKFIKHIYFIFKLITIIIIIFYQTHINFFLITYFINTIKITYFINNNNQTGLHNLFSLPRLVNPKYTAIHHTYFLFY